MTLVIECPNCRTLIALTTKPVGVIRCTKCGAWLEAGGPPHPAAAATRIERL